MKKNNLILADELPDGKFKIEGTNHILAKEELEKLHSLQGGQMATFHDYSKPKQQLKTNTK